MRKPRFRWTTFRIVLAVFALHLAGLLIILSIRTIDFLPNRRLPYVPPAKAPNFGIQTRVEVDPDTGQRVEVTEYIVSTGAFVEGSPSETPTSATGTEP